MLFIKLFFYLKNKIAHHPTKSLFISGVLLNLALPPYYVLFFIPISLIVLLDIILKSKNQIAAFSCGMIFAFGHFLIGLYWIFAALLVDANLYGMIPFILPALVIYVLPYGFLSWVCFLSKNKSPIITIILFAIFWVLAELWRSYLLMPLPWNLLGYSFGFSNYLSQIASVVGIYGLSFLVVFIGLLFYLRNLYSYFVAVFLLMAIFIFGFIRINFFAQVDFDQRIQIRIIQPNISLADSKIEENKIAILKKNLRLSRSTGYEKITHIIWPETAIEEKINYHSIWLNILKQVVPNNGLLIFGAAMQDKNGSLNNSMILLNQNATVVDVYHKHHLVPYGEYVPFRDLFPFLKTVTRNNFYISPGEQKIISNQYLPDFLPLICFDSAYSLKTKEVAEQKFDFILNINNEAWFKNANVLQQSFINSKFRAIEYGVPLIRTSNTAFSAVIDPFGRVISEIGINQEGVIDSALPKPIMGGTIYGKI